MRYFVQVRVMFKSWQPSKYATFSWCGWCPFLSNRLIIKQPLENKRLSTGGTLSPHLSAKFQSTNTRWWVFDTQIWIWMTWVLDVSWMAWLPLGSYNFCPQVTRLNLVLAHDAEWHYVSASLRFNDVSVASSIRLFIFFFGQWVYIHLLNRGVWWQ